MSSNQKPVNPIGLFLSAMFALVFAIVLGCVMTFVVGGVIADRNSLTGEQFVGIVTFATFTAFPTVIFFILGCVNLVRLIAASIRNDVAREV